MKLYELLENVEIQCSMTVCRYDYEKNERVELHADEAMGKDVRFLYVDNGDELFIEVSD